ncbi:MAG TPA: hypothetical protein VMQ56_17215 [Terracidiphilus sp.]|nr:hypothetical protein [Terracidiphilus sp.]
MNVVRETHDPDGKEKTAITQPTVDRGPNTKFEKKVHIGQQTESATGYSLIAGESLGKSEDLETPRELAGPNLIS